MKICLNLNSIFKVRVAEMETILTRKSSFLHFCLLIASFSLPIKQRKTKKVIENYALAAVKDIYGFT